MWCVCIRSRSGQWQGIELGQDKEQLAAAKFKTSNIECNPLNIEDGDLHLTADSSVTRSGRK